MGYFNIFYKITRIIDMLTRKRNRKFILALCLVGAIVFFSPSTVRADFSSGDSYNLNQIYNKVNNIDFNCNYYFTKFNTYLDLSSGFLSTIRTDTGIIKEDVKVMQSDLQICESYLLTMMQDIDHIDDDMHDLLIKIEDVKTKLDTLQDTVDNIESILNSIGEDVEHYGELNHQDQEEIKTIIREYLYGDAGEFDVTFKTLSNATISGTSVITLSNNASNLIYYIPLKNGYRYDLSWTFYRKDGYNYPRIAFGNAIPTINDTVANLDMSFEANDTTSYTYTSDGTYKYLYFSTNTFYVRNFNVVSNYNEGQEQGVYGGLTDINNQTRQQGEQTRETITSTDYNQGDVSINSDSITNVDTTQTDGLFTTIFTNFNNAATGGVDTISIPLPYNSGNLVLHSNLVSSHLGALSTLVSAFWYFVFGFYAFKFVNNLLHNIKDGSILDGFKNNNEVITQDML